MPQADNPLIVQSDRTLLLDVHAPRADECRNALIPFAELERSPEHLHTYRITALSLWNAASAGFSSEQAVQVLEDFARYPVPESVVVWLEETALRFGKIRMVPAPEVDGQPYVYLVCQNAFVYKEISSNALLAKHLSSSEYGQLVIFKGCGILSVHDDLPGGLVVVDVSAHDGQAGDHHRAFGRNLHGGVLQGAADAAFHVFSVIELVGSHAADLRSAIRVVKFRLRQGLGQLFHLGMGDWGRAGFDEINPGRNGTQPIVGELHDQTDACRDEESREMLIRKVEHLEEGIDVLYAVQDADGAAGREDGMDLEEAGDMVERSADDKEQVLVEVHVHDEVLRAGA